MLTSELRRGLPGMSNIDRLSDKQQFDLLGHINRCLAVSIPDGLCRAATLNLQQPAPPSQVKDGLEEAWLHLACTSFVNERTQDLQ